MLKVCLSGLGRAGTQIARYLAQRPQKVRLVSAICSPGSPKSGMYLDQVIGCGPAGVPIYPSDQLRACLEETEPDIAIDFSNSFAALRNAEIFSDMGVKLVMGTTGFSKSEENKLYSIINKNHGTLIFAPNITRGVNAAMLFAALATRILPGYDMQIVEMHHKQKTDIPSGTAKKIAREMAEGCVAAGNQTAEIPVHSIRAGGIVGFHKILLVGESDMIEITHHTFSRDCFAEGALTAAEFIQNKTGVFQMKDALNFQNAVEDYFALQQEPVSEETG